MVYLPRAIASAEMSSPRSFHQSFGALLQQPCVFGGRHHEEGARAPAVKDEGERLRRRRELAAELQQAVGHLVGVTPPSAQVVVDDETLPAAGKRLKL